MKTLITLTFLSSLIVLGGCENQQDLTSNKNFENYVNENMTKEPSTNTAVINMQF